MSTSTVFTADPDLDLENTTSLPSFSHTFESFHYALTHVFLPVELPDHDDYSPQKDLPLLRAVCAAAHAYTTYIHKDPDLRWYHVRRMLDRLHVSLQSEQLDKEQVICELRGMQSGDILTYFIRRQNAAIILTKRENSILFESFEVSPREVAVERAPGSLVCSYPWSAIEVSNEVVDDQDFQFGFADFLSLPNAVDSDFPPPPAAHPQYITALLFGILRGVGRAAEVPSITKRIRDHVGRPQQSDVAAQGRGVWRRSSLWLLVRIAIQISIDRSPLGRASYKEFLLFFICTFARDAKDKNLSNNLLHLMSSKILQRLGKLGSAIPGRLSEMALDTCARLQEVLDTRWIQLQSIHSRPSPFRNPSQEELARDTQPSLLESSEYICNALANRHREPLSTPFHPTHHRRGTIDDFLSPNGATFLEDVYHTDPDTTLYDIERSVEQEIDEWLARVTNVDDACAQLEILMDKYIVKAHIRWDGSPEDSSITALTALELFVALDKLVIKEIPMLSDYSPEIPIAFLETLLLRKATGLHRLSRVYRYLSMRHSQTFPGWSVFSNEFTDDSFPVRYYDQSPHLQRLKVRIEQDTKELLPTKPLHTKVIVFELQCPACIRIWRSAAPRILHYFHDPYFHHALPGDKIKEQDLLGQIPALQYYFTHHERTPLAVQIHFACFDSEGSPSRNSPTLRYAIQCPTFREEYTSPEHYGVVISPENSFSTWPRTEHHELSLPSYKRTYSLENHTECSSCKNLGKYVDYTTHTSNDALAAQAECPVDLSLDEFITFTHMRSGGSLQWINILRGLRSRTLNFRRHHVHYLLSQAIFQVGPLDLKAGTWSWHQELQDPSFCGTLLDELWSLFVDVGVGSIDGTVMSTISLLLTRVLASSPSEVVSKRSVAFLRSVRRKTFSWAQELSYNLAKAPMNKERSDLLLDMASTCRSTFDVDSVILRELFCSAEDVDATLSCAFLIHALPPKRIRMRDPYSLLLLQRDRRISFALEEALSDAILADASDYGVDLAVRKIFAGHKPSACRWEHLQHPNSRYLISGTRMIAGQPSQTVHFNLLDGSLRVDGQPIGGLPRVMRDSPKCQMIFRDQGFFVIPSTLPGMDFTTLAAISRHKIHFSLRGDNLVVRAKCNQSNDVLEMIPTIKLLEDLPPALVLGHVHWLNLSTGIIEIRPLEQLWEESAENWRIDCASGQCRVYKGRDTLVDVRSPTWAMASKLFECLNNVKTTSLGMFDLQGDQTRNLVITASPIDSFHSVQVLGLSVALPRYGLSFFANTQGELESCDFKDMVYDENQSVGALPGLENCLVLRQRTHLAEGLIPRRVLIPNVHFEEHGDYQVGADAKYHRFDQPDEPLYYTYIVDTELGCLIGDGSSSSTQHLARLHVMTSWDRPDLLTGKTGAQAALHLFQSAGCRSTMKRKTPESSNHWDGNLTQYPQIKVVHDRIRWSTNHYYHHEFVGTADRRAMRRAEYLFPSGATGKGMEDCEDTDYLTLESDLELEEVAFTIASAIRRWFFAAPAPNTIPGWVSMWSNSNMRVDAVSPPSLFDSPEGCPNNYQLLQTLHNVPGKEGTRWRFQLLFLLPTVAYCSPCHQTAFLSMLVVFTRHLDSQSSDNPPIHTGCNISDGYRPTVEIMRDHFRKACLDPEPLYSHWDGEKNMVDPIVEDLLKDWPSDGGPMVPDWLNSSRLWDVANLSADLRRLFSSCYRNFRLKEHLIRLLVEPGSSILLRPISTPKYIFNKCAPWKITLHQLLSNRSAPELPRRVILLRDGCKTLSDAPSQLKHLFSSISTKKSKSSFQQEYVALLERSAQCVREECSMTHGLSGEDRISTLEQHYAHCRVNYLGALDTLKKTLGPTTDPRQHALCRFGQWPPITADVLLRCLASTSPLNLPQKWKKWLISLALLLLDLQRARRLLRFALDGLEEEFSKELENDGCDGWDPEAYPEWILIQIQGNFLIRRTQAEIAMEIISPQSGENTVMQVKMGEGKSSVIIPIAAAVLANGEQLVRVIVPKALTAQMFELLVSRLGGLANRPIFYLPFSRFTESTSDEWSSGADDKCVRFHISDVQSITRHCMAQRGILLLQPEHVASLKLVSVEEQIHKGKFAAEAVPSLRQLIYKHIATTLSLDLLPQDCHVGDMFRWLSRPPSYLCKKDTIPAEHHEDSGDANSTLDNISSWFGLQKWFHSYARDILDESDEILHARFQLIYTIGLHQHTDGYSDRWTITQHVLRLVKQHVYSLSEYAPDLVEHEYGPPGSFPYIHILRPSDVGRHLVSLIVEDVMASQLPNLKFQGISSALRDAIRSFISDEDILQVPDTAKRVEEYANLCSQQVWNGLLLLRGLLSSNILFSALAERRWRVDYGLALPSGYPNHHSPPPTMLAVPYRAKDVPAPNTHFGHPDMTIILTCLSYYYGGLDKKQLRISFEILLDEDDPSTEYSLWVKEYDSRSLPESLRKLGEINLKSSEQWDKVIFPLFTRNQGAIDFYLSRVVFPHEMKEYPWKLCGTSWDLAEKRERLITGFSGTNDGRWLLPMSIAQCELDHQQGTNARVLTYLLQPENDSYTVTHERGQRQTTVEFLRVVAAQQPVIRVLLDVGAQILDFSNRKVAKAWLDNTQNAAGAVYFNENDELIVLMRNGSTVPLLSSSLSQQLDRCIVYLDHAHTSGTDIKLPIGSRAAVTLGPKVTKDRLVQGCMRMRKLGHGHSVMFFAPPEVDRSIRAISAGRDSNAPVTIVDILSWAINETWTDIQQRAPYWAQQGMNHKSRYNAWINFASKKFTREKLVEAWLQPELKSLADLYAPSETKKSSCSLSRLDPEIQQRCKNLGVLSLPNAQMAEEHEREVNREQEREREVELPPKAEPIKHCLHPDVVEFVNTGHVPPLNASSAFHPIFTTLEKSSAATPEAHVWSPFILATADFCNTIKPASTQGTIDQYLRPVQWVLSCKQDRYPLLVLLSPFEVDCLMPDIRASEHVHLHVYAPRTSQRMKPSDDLRLYSIPPLPSDWTPPWALIDQLNVFAGQVYLRDYSSYLRVCHFLGVPTKESLNDTGVRWNLFNIPGSIEEEEIRFSGSPLPSVMALLSIRSRGRPFTRTHMGQILQGNILTRKDFKGLQPAFSGGSIVACSTEILHDDTSRTLPIAMECGAPDVLGRQCSSDHPSDGYDG